MELSQSHIPETGLTFRRERIKSRNKEAEEELVILEAPAPATDTDETLQTPSLLVPQRKHSVK